MALPNTNISTTLVGNTLGAASRDVGTLCTHPNINKWSKWKPVRFNKVTGLTLSELQSINYGIGINNYSSVDNVKSAYASEISVWTYLRPRGGQLNEFYRLGDFRNYNHSASEIVGGSTVTSNVSNELGKNNDIIASLFVTGNASSSELSWADLNLSGRKIGLALFDGGTLVRTAVASTSSATSVRLNVREPTVLPAKNYNAHFFLTNGSGGTSVNVGGIPNQPLLGNIVRVRDSSDVTIQIRALWDEALSNTVYITVTGRNDTVGTVSLLNSTIKLRYYKNLCTSTLQTEEKQLNLGTLTIPPSSSEVVLYDSLTTVNRSAFSSWKWCWSNEGVYPNTDEGAIMMVQPD